MSRTMPRSLMELSKANQAQSNKHKPAFEVSHDVFPCLIIHMPLRFLIVECLELITNDRNSSIQRK